ncbi:hypothetical protein [Streptomyces sp. NPDC101150]|uniref:hypothetical protein n=1 Tax=Streptomyces sp. NPDC101150 TaxID=3366114 RepID=UPI0037F31B54
MWDLEELWLEGSVLAVIHAAGPEQGYWVDGSGLQHDDGSSNWWQLMPLGNGRAVVMGKDHELPGDLYDDLPGALADGPGWLRDAWEGDDRPLRAAVRSMAPIGFFFWTDADGTWGNVPTDDSRDDGSGLVTAPCDAFADRLAERYDGAGDLTEAQASAEALFAAARAGTLDAGTLLPVLRRLDPQRARPFDLAAALKVAGLAGLTPGTRRPAFPTAKGS